MSANPDFIAATAKVDEAAVKPLPNSRKVYVQGSRPDIQVPMREISTCTFLFIVYIRVLLYLLL